MKRRTFVAVTGSIAGLAGCINVPINEGPGDDEQSEEQTITDDSNGGNAAGGDSTGGGSGDGNPSDRSGGGGSGSFVISGFGTNTPINAGAFFESSVAIENTGSSAGTREIRLVVGNDPEVVETRTVTLAAGERTTLSMGYETPRVDRTQEFPVRVETPDDAVERIVTVYGTNDFGGSPRFEVEIVGTNTPVSAGEYLEVRATVRNASDTTSATRTVALVVGHDPERVDARTLTLSPNGATTIGLGYTTPTVDNDQTFPVRVETNADAAVRSVLVYGTG